MNDRFKFRVWDRIHKRYIYCDFAGYCSVDYSWNGEKRIVFMPSGVEQIKNGRPLLYAKEDEAEIGQCTGLKDKNGELIYDGDVVEVSEAYENGIYKIEFCQSDCEYNLYNKEGNFIYQLTKSMAKYMKVIGNIHENKELLDEQ